MLLGLKYKYTLKHPNEQKPDGFSSECYQTFEEELIQSLLEPFQKLKRELFQTHFSRPALPWYPDKGTIRKENYKPISLINELKNTQKEILGNQTSIIFWKDHTPLSSGMYSRDAKMVQYLQINKCDIPQ